MCPARKWNESAVGSFDFRREIAYGVVLESWLKKFKVHRLDHGQLQISLILATSRSHKTWSLTDNRSEAPNVVQPTNPASDWILSNLTTQEFVELELHTKRRYAQVKGEPWLTLDVALLLRISWSEAVVEGKWAGHCFDVVNRENLKSATGWTNVTAELVKEAKDLDVARA